MDNITTLTGTQIPLGRMYALKGALKLEITGMTRRGRSAYSIIKNQFGLKGSRKKVLADFQKLIHEHEERVVVCDATA
jgi:hypothetical protein